MLRCRILAELFYELFEFLRRFFRSPVDEIQKQIVQGDEIDRSVVELVESLSE